MRFTGAPFQQRVPYLSAQLEEPRIILDVGGPRPGKIDGDVGDDSCRSRRGDEHSIAESYRFADRMGDEDRRDAATFDKLIQENPHLRASDLIESGQRFVHRQQGSAEGEGPHEGDALLHAAAELVRMGVEKRSETDALQQLDRVAGGRSVGAAIDVEQQTSVGSHGPPWEETGVLRHDCDLLVAPRDGRRLAVHRGAAGGRRLQTGDHTQKGGLSASRRPDDADERTFFDLEVDTGDCFEVSEGFAQSSQRDGTRHGRWSPDIGESVRVRGTAFRPQTSAIARPGAIMGRSAGAQPLA